MHSTAIQPEIEFPDELRPGTVLLHGQYVIESNLVRGGFGITYLARDSLDRIVVIKECFPGTICSRIDGTVRARSRQFEKQFASVLRHFIREARRMSKLNHPRIVGVHQVFEENGTAYMALDHVEGSDLLTVLETDPARLHPEAVMGMLRQVLDAVSYIHKEGILHRDISPDNILLDDHDQLTLIDFGAAREDATRENRALSALLTVKDGYSPQEFYLSDEPQRLSSDLYSLGATFHHLITGEAPPQSQQRLAAVATRGDDPYLPLVLRISGYDEAFLAAIDRALEVFPDDRFQSAEDWIAAIQDSLTRQRAAESARTDDSMLRAISEMIANGEISEDTAATPEPLPPRSGRGASARRPTEVLTRGADESRFVDIFGNPVEDVDAWLADQERDLKRQRATAARAAEPVPKQTELRGGFLRALLGLKPPQSAGRCDG
jgi:serine/threonine protein kinase